MTPRRSSRARATQPPSVGPQHTASSSSSSSSNSLTRAERSTRSHNKNQSPPTSSTQRSQSLDYPEDASKNADPPQTRQRRRGRDDEVDDTGKEADNNVEEEEDVEAEEITRCICGQQEYPGPPVMGRDKPTVKDEGALTVSTAASEALSEDPGSFFIQCDSCKVWQHGGCVGIMDESLNPDEYFCEQCRKDFHKLFIAANGQKYSNYLPVLDVSTPRSSSTSSRDDTTRKKDSRSSRQNTNNSSTKRRSTMNSRDAAYDEGELLRRAIEESKLGGSAPPTDIDGNRRGKRSRSESEEIDKSAKRQRTGSDSPGNHDSEASQPPETDNEQTGNATTNGNQKKIRGAAARNHREKELRDREMVVEKERADAAGRRRNRADRRRGEDSDPSESVSPSKQVSQPPPPSSQPVPDTPASHSQENLASKSASHRKTGRPPAKRGRVGRNQYTRDRDLLPNGSHDRNHHNSPMRSDSRDGEEPHNGVNGHNGGSGETGRPSKPKYMNPHRTTMNEMKRRVAAILEFISQMKAELGTEHANAATPTSGSSSVAAAAMIRGVEAELAGILAAHGDDKGGGKDFGEMTSGEMMGDLVRKLVGWQSEFGRYGEK